MTPRWFWPLIAALVLLAALMMWRIFSMVGSGAPMWTGDDHLQPHSRTTGPTTVGTTRRGRLHLRDGTGSKEPGLQSKHAILLRPGESNLT